MTAEKSDNKIGIQMPPRDRMLGGDGAVLDVTYIVPISEALERRLQIKNELNLPEGVFLKKEEYHATAVGFGHADQVTKAIERNPGMRDKINELLSSIDFSFTLLSDTIRIIHNLDFNAEKTAAGQAHDSEYTVTVDIDMPGMAAFYEGMKGLGMDLGEAASHVTLFKKDNGEATGLGIGIYDFEKQVAGELSPRIEVRSLSLKDIQLDE